MSPSIVSRRVVATTISSSALLPPTTLYANSVNVPNSYFACFVCPGTASFVPPFTSSLSTSMSEIADLSAHDQLTSRFARYMMPASWKRQNASTTAREHIASIVKRSRDQSTLEPSVRIWWQMCEPNFAFHSHTRSRNLSRPRSWRVRRSSFLSIFSTTDCVAMPAWSVPGTYSVVSPRMRCQRVSVSSIAAVSACPMCSEPVTFGGGITITNFLSASTGPRVLSAE